MAEWKDETKGWDPPIVKASRVRFGQFRLSVHRHMDYPKDTWLTSCAYLFTCHELAGKEISEAKCQAKAYLKAVLKNALDETEK